MKFSVGLQNLRHQLLQSIRQYAPRIREVYFSWGDFPNGRSSQLQGDGHTPWELQQCQQEALRDTNFIRPEDIHKYEPYFETAKLATRIHRNPAMVLDSYVRGRYSGNILELLEPAHSIYPYVVENGDPLRLVKIEEV